MDLMKILRMQYNVVEEVFYCRTCMMDFFRNDIVGEKRTVENTNEFYFLCERSHYMNYLLDDASLIDVRSRNIQVRKLNKDKISTEKNYWKSLNTASPLFVLAIFGTAVVYSRKKRWTKKN